MLACLAMWGCSYLRIIRVGICDDREHDANRFGEEM